jgi:hypothetical protein
MVEKLPGAEGPYIMGGLRIVQETLEETRESMNTDSARYFEIA